ncbi:ribonucleotide-diphosphate reductase subunit beta [Bifidobacterium sp. ESL0763]|uniref:ribonucleotide-diphosphate reductase subunit beta n=1 Tax=Bifidobacterium sp. ESL0763 TaxID=2983227 RepID=UPI0023F9B8B5|nr:ribonucleotide-diphosphate reductase subunit beta [Bifidobacterium sp. ESL0763]MDF7663210.1 ribonucleotide-diphosphate reductase subunit beta [Bifidobacterium sp. ESL0763]
MTFTAMNWNLGGAGADTGRDVFATMTANLWTPEQVSLADDADDIANLGDTERLALTRIFAALATLESLQATTATGALMADAGNAAGGTANAGSTDGRTGSDGADGGLGQAALTAIAFGEAMHTKAYSTLIAAIGGNEATGPAFEWAQRSEAMQEKLGLLSQVYAATANTTATTSDDQPENTTTSNSENGDTSQAGSGSDAGPAADLNSAVDSAVDSATSSTQTYDIAALKRLAAAVLAEVLLAESGFYLPMWLSSRGTLAKSADLVRLVNRDIVTSSSYLGSVYQRSLATLGDDTREEMRQYVYDLANNLYFAEEDFGYELPYGEIGLEDDIEKFLSYNANKALSYLGYPALFPAEISQPNPAVTDELNDMDSLDAALKSGGPLAAGAGAGTRSGFGSAGSSASSATSSSTGATAANKAEETSDDDWDF